MFHVAQEPFYPNRTEKILHARRRRHKTDEEMKNSPTATTATQRYREFFPVVVVVVVVEKSHDIRTVTWLKDSKCLLQK